MFEEEMPKFAPLGAGLHGFESHPSTILPAKMDEPTIRLFRGGHHDRSLRLARKNVNEDINS